MEDPSCTSGWLCDSQLMQIVVITARIKYAILVFFIEKRILKNIVIDYRWLCSRLPLMESLQSRVQSCGGVGG